MGIPPRLVAAVNELQHLDETESDALGLAVVQSYGDCKCQTWQTIGGHRVGWTEICDGHRFLMEDDRACTRIQHLRFGRAMAGRWQVAEHGLAEFLNRGLRS